MFPLLSVSYIPAADAEVHRQTLLIQQTAAKELASSEETNREVGEESVSLKTEQRQAVFTTTTTWTQVQILFKAIWEWELEL